MMVTPPALRATSPFFDRGGAADALKLRVKSIVSTSQHLNFLNTQITK